MFSDNQAFHFIKHYKLHTMYAMVCKDEAPATKTYADLFEDLYHIFRKTFKSDALQ